MQFTHLGRSGLSVSRLCLGTMNFGPRPRSTDAHSIMDSAHDAGIDFFDTANVYGAYSLCRKKLMPASWAESMIE